MNNILFDEKIMGSIHFTPGNCYDDAYNGNKSAIHWDLVLIQTEEYGGGEIYFDDRLIRKNGRFVYPNWKLLIPKILNKPISKLSDIFLNIQTTFYLQNKNQIL